MATTHKNKENRFSTRRSNLIKALAEAYPHASPQSIVLFLAGFENERVRFRQDSSFYYMTGIEEPGVALTQNMQGNATLWIPNCMPARSQWLNIPISFEQKNAAHFGVDTITYLGTSCTGYQFHPFFPKSEYELLMSGLAEVIANGGLIFTLAPDDSSSYIEQRLVLERLKNSIPGFANALIDIAPFVHAMRRKKDTHEIELLYQAIEITNRAHIAAAHAIGVDVKEAEVQATLEYMMIGSNARVAFPSIVASGKNATILHYSNNNDILAEEDLIIVDIGAEFGNYCADITRTYPVSGSFNERQRELYTIVLQTQEHVAKQARPGMWLSNKERPELSLHHIALRFLAEYGYEKYFVHGIGHFLGLDVHDVGNRSVPLQEGDVITIEPGLYLPEEGIGIRIEDNYWIINDGALCLSEDLPKSIEDIEKVMQSRSLAHQEQEEAQESSPMFDEDDDLAQS